MESIHHNYRTLQAELTKLKLKLYPSCTLMTRVDLSLVQILKFFRRAVITSAVQYRTADPACKLIFGRPYQIHA